MTTRKERILWIMGTIVPIYAMFIAGGVISPDLALLFILPGVILFFILFIKLLYSQESPLWNGLIAFVFWLPVVGFFLAQPGKEAIAKGKVYDELIITFGIALAHSSIQFVGRLFINRFHPQENNHSKRGEMILRNKRILWIMGAFVVLHASLIGLFMPEPFDSEVLGGILAPSAVICFFVLFFSLMYVEKSCLWNGIIAFLFWMPVMGWYWVLPRTEEVAFYDVFYVVFPIGLVHACIQILGRMVINKSILWKQSR